MTGFLDLGYQYNHREEWSEFHTHYGTQQPPEKDPDKELEFSLHTFSALARINRSFLYNWEYTAGWDMQYQHNTTGGYSFLLPEYNRITSGAFMFLTYRPNNVFFLNGGIRYDYGKIKTKASEDTYLAVYLVQMGYDAGLIDTYRWRSYAVDRSFGDISGSLGMVWTPAPAHMVKLNIGRSFRLPGANELASNGVHHSAFRHEQGDSSLPSEQGWQLDADYTWQKPGWRLSFSPYISWYENYIYLKPTGEWSVLPHAGQIYRYTGAKAMLGGMEMAVEVDIYSGFKYSFTGEYNYTYNRDEHIPLSFSPPASMRNRLAWHASNVGIYAEVQSIASQHRIDRNEDPTSGISLLHMGVNVSLPPGATNAEILLSVHNLFDTTYYNHLSFYRKIEVPEPGRNFRIVIKVPF